MKIAEKLATNARLGPITRVARISPGVTPATAEMYPGTSGSTHGDRNEIRPAPNATGIPMPEAGSISLIMERVRQAAHHRVDEFGLAHPRSQRAVGIQYGPRLTTSVCVEA